MVAMFPGMEEPSRHRRYESLEHGGVTADGRAPAGLTGVLPEWGVGSGDGGELQGLRGLWVW